ncbi:hypothetical protein ACP70R_001192 [Stipagrostis hirtigluma subsp. patula]
MEASPLFALLSTRVHWLPLPSRARLVLYLPPLRRLPAKRRESLSEGDAGITEERGAASEMVVLMEEFHGLTLKRKGADEPALFDVGGDDRSGFPLACRATKMRRLVRGDGREEGAPAAGGAVAATAGQQQDVPMGDKLPSSTGAGDEKAGMMVAYSGGPGEGARALPRLRPWANLRSGADWVIRAMLREADSRTVREMLAGAPEQSADLALAVVPWTAPPPAETEPATAAEASDGGDSEGTAAMDVEEDEGQDQSRQWAGQTYGGTGAGHGEGYVYRWPQHCMAPPQLPAVAQASPVMWSW